MSLEHQHQIAEPTTPAVSTKDTMYVGTDGRRKHKDSKGNVHTLTPMGWRDNNIIINGEFDYAQRQAPATLTTYSNLTGRAYGADRWAMTNENASIQFQRIDTSAAVEIGLQSRYYGKYKKITGAGKIAVSQAIEAGNMMHLRGRTVRIQFKLRYSLGTPVAFRFGLIQLTSAGTIDTIPATYISAFNAGGSDPTLGANLAYIVPKSGLTPETATISGNALDCVPTTSWQRFSGCFDIPTNCKNLVLMFWSNTQMAVNDEVCVSEIGLYDGMEIRDWFPRIQGDQFGRIQRYCWKTFAPDTAPVQNGGVSGAIREQVAIAAAVTTSSVIQIRFPVSMFKAPTFIFYNPSAANAFLRNVPAATDATLTAAANITTESADVNATGLAAWTAGQEIKVHCLADAEL